MIMSKYKVIYTCGNNKKMLLDLRDSVESALKYISANDIIIIFSPPYNLDAVDEFKSMCKVIIKDKNITDAFCMHPHNNDCKPKLYGEKLWITEIPYKNILFLDCDTYINNDPVILYDGDFDFGGVAIDYPKKEKDPWQINQNILNKMIRIYKLNKDAHLWNGGHLMFKNYLHNKIRDTWLKYFNDKDPMRLASPIKNTDDQLSLTPTLNCFKDAKIRIYNENEIMKTGWYKDSWYNYKFSDDICIFHGDNLKSHLLRRK